MPNPINFAGGDRRPIRSIDGSPHACRRFHRDQAATGLPPARRASRSRRGDAPIRARSAGEGRTGAGSHGHNRRSNDGEANARSHAGAAGRPLKVATRPAEWLCAGPTTTQLRPHQCCRPADGEGGSSQSPDTGHSPSHAGRARRSRSRGWRALSPAGEPALAGNRRGPTLPRANFDPLLANHAARRARGAWAARLRSPLGLPWPAPVGASGPYVARAPASDRSTGKGPRSINALLDCVGQPVSQGASLHCARHAGASNGSPT
jgi:hypothetical protein